MILATYIQGIPCRVRVTHYVPAVAPIIAGPTDWSDPGAAAEIDFDVLDRRGRPAPWLERRMLSEDRNVIEQTIIAAKARERQDAAELAYAEWGARA